MPGIRKARVLQFAATHGGGLATHVATLARGLSREKYDVRVLCPDSGELRRRLDRLQVAYDSVPVSTEMDLAADARLLKAIWGYLGRHRFDVVHTHSTKAGFLGRIAARARGVPVVLYTGNGYRFLRYRSGSPRWLAYVAVEWLGGRFGATVAAGPSEAALTSRLRLAGESGRFAVNNGVAVFNWDQILAAPGARARFGVPDGRPLVVTIGRLMTQKAPLVFVEAAARVASARPEVEFVMVGEGDLEAAVRRRAAELGLGPQLHLIRRTDEVAALLAEADVFVMTSRYEGLSYAALEAGAAGRAMVLSDVPGLRDLIQQEQNGLLVPPHDPERFARAILRLLGDPELRQRLGAAAARTVAERFNGEQMIRETEQVYDRLLARAGLSL